MHWSNSTQVTISAQKWTKLYPSHHWWSLSASYQMSVFQDETRSWDKSNKLWKHTNVKRRRERGGVLTANATCLCLMSSARLFNWLAGIPTANFGAKGSGKPSSASQIDWESTEPILVFTESCPPRNMHQPAQLVHRRRLWWCNPWWTWLLQSCLHLIHRYIGKSNEAASIKLFF